MMFSIIILMQLNLEWDENKFNLNQMENQIGTVLHWSNEREPQKAKMKSSGGTWI